MAETQVWANPIVLTLRREFIHGGWVVDFVVLAYPQDATNVGAVYLADWGLWVVDDLPIWHLVHDVQPHTFQKRGDGELAQLGVRGSIHHVFYVLVDLHVMSAARVYANVAEFELETQFALAQFAENWQHICDVGIRCPVVEYILHGLDTQWVNFWCSNLSARQCVERTLPTLWCLNYGATCSCCALPWSSPSLQWCGWCGAVR